MKRICGALAIAIFAAFNPYVVGSQPQRLDPLTRQLGDLGSGRASGTPAEIVALVKRGLDEPSTRYVALLTIVGRARPALAAKAAAPIALESWLEEQQALAALRPQVENILSDEDTLTRHAAVMALGALAIEASRLPDVVIDSRAWIVLRRTYQRDSSTTVRGEIMKTAALTAGAEEARKGIIGLGLADTDAGVLSQAIRGAARLNVVRSLPQIAALLQHSDRNVRLVAAGEIATFGRSAAPYASALESAAAHEPDETVRATMLASLSVLRSKE